MNDILVHYGVKGMKWGVRKQYEGTGGGGGGGWGPNTIATGGGPSPLAASMSGNPKKKKSIGKAEVQKMGVKDKKKVDPRHERAKIDLVNTLSEYNESMNSYNVKGFTKSEKKLEKQLNSFFKTYGDDAVSNIDSKLLNDGRTMFEVQFKSDDFKYLIIDDVIVKAKP